MNGMDCRDARRLIHMMLDGELQSKDEAVLLEHLRRCRRCAEELKGLRAVVRRLGELPRPEPAPGLKRKIMARMRRRAVPRLAAAGLWASAAAAVLAVGALGVRKSETPKWFRSAREAFHGLAAGALGGFAHLREETHACVSRSETRLRDMLQTAGAEADRLSGSLRAFPWSLTATFLLIAPAAMWGLLASLADRRPGAGPGPSERR